MEGGIIVIQDVEEQALGEVGLPHPRRFQSMLRSENAIMAGESALILFADHVGLLLARPSTIDFYCLERCIGTLHELLADTGYRECHVVPFLYTHAEPAHPEVRLHASKTTDWLSVVERFAVLNSQFWFDGNALQCSTQEAIAVTLDLRGEIVTDCASHKTEPLEEIFRYSDKGLHFPRTLVEKHISRSTEGDAVVARAIKSMYPVPWSPVPSPPRHDSPRTTYHVSKRPCYKCIIL